MNGMTGFHLFTIKGIPIAFSPWFLLLIIILSSTATSLSGGIIFAVVATFGILFHELGHAFTSQHYHLSPKVLLHGWGGLTLHDPAKNNKSDIVITAAGPLVGLVIGGLFCAIKYIMIANLGAEWLSDRPLMSDFLTYSIWVNLGWGIFNLLPIYPMDGGHLLSSALQFKFSQTRSLEITYFVSIIIGVLMLAGSLWLRSFFMIFLSGMMIYTNYVSYKKTRSVSKLISGDQGAKQALKKQLINQVSLKAEAIYVNAESAAREHKWEELETLANEMLKCSVTEEQERRAYELLVIAKTNMGEYESALEYVDRANSTEAVKQARQRCERMVNMK